jgi:hypothetical protein
MTYGPWVPSVPCPGSSTCCVVFQCASTDGRLLKSVDSGVSWVNIDGTPITDGAVPVACTGGSVPPENKPWFYSDLGVLPAGVTTINHGLGLADPNEMLVQLWDQSGVEPLQVNVSNRTANTVDVTLASGSLGSVTVVVGRSNLN